MSLHFPGLTARGYYLAPLRGSNAKFEEKSEHEHRGAEQEHEQEEEEEKRTD